MSDHRESDQAILRRLKQSPAVGGGYFNPVVDLTACGRRLEQPAQTEDALSVEELSSDRDTYAVSTLFEMLVRGLRPEEVLFGLYDSGRFVMAPQIISAERLFEFELQVAEGRLERLGFYGVNRPRAFDALATDFEAPRERFPRRG